MSQFMGYEKASADSYRSLYYTANKDLIEVKDDFFNPSYVKNFVTYIFEQGSTESLTREQESNSFFEITIR